MKNKAPLALMEQLIMLLVFALAAALCLQVFVNAGRISRFCEMRSHGVTVAQNAAEALKANSGDLEQCARSRGGTWDDRIWQQGYDDCWQLTSSENAEFLLQVTLAEEQVPLLGRAEIEVKKADGERLVGFSVSWQEDTHG